jgi:glycosyltransferase involved in cell wall biosynthesis
MTGRVLNESAMTKYEALSSRPMRIAMLMESDGPGGAEIVCLRLAQELSRRGHQVIPVVPRDGVGWLGSQYRASGFEPETFWLKGPIDFSGVSRLRAIIEKNNIDVVHSHEFTMAVYGAAASRLAGRRHVVTMHGSQTVGKALRRRIALRWAFSRSAVTTTISEETKSHMVAELGVRPENLLVIPNGVPDRAGNPERVMHELQLRPTDVVLVAVGNLDVRKSHIHILQALAKIGARVSHLPWKLVIVGGRGGSELNALNQFAAEHGFADRLHILMNRTDVADILSASTIFVMPSLFEGLPMALLEAMIAGKPAVASSVGGIPEAIQHGKSGFLFPASDVDKLGEHLLTLLCDPPLRERLGAAARQIAVSKFTVQKMTDLYEETYRKS